MLIGFESVLSIFIMIFIGYYMARNGTFDNRTSGVFSKLVFDVSLPMLMVTSVYSNFTREAITGSYVGIAAAFATILAGYAAGKLIFRLAYRNERVSSIHSVMFSFSNTIFIGLPVCISVLGEKAAPYALLYYFANTTLFWTMGLYSIKSEKGQGEAKDGDNPFKKIFSPPFAGFVAGLLLVFTGIRLPEFILSTFKYMGAMTTPLSMLIIGIMIYNLDRTKKGCLDSRFAIVMLGKFILLPAITIAAVCNLEMPLLMKKAFILQSAMPVMAQSAIVARKYETDQKEVSYAVSMSTLISMAAIPVYIFIANIIK